MNTMTATTISTKDQIARRIAPHFWATQHEYTRIVLGGLCELVVEPLSIKTRERYAWNLRESISRVDEQLQYNGQHTTYDPQIIDLLRELRGTIVSEDTKADNGYRVLQTLRKIEGILADDINACTCVSEPNLICFGTYHLN